MEQAKSQRQRCKTMRCSEAIQTESYIPDFTTDYSMERWAKRTSRTRQRPQKPDGAY
jgi:hypothetical protein